MVKFLIVIGIIFIILLTIVIRIRKKINSFLNNFVPPQGQTNREGNSKDEEVVYNKDDIVVLKGDAKRK